MNKTYNCDIIRVVEAIANTAEEPEVEEPIEIQVFGFFLTVSQASNILVIPHSLYHRDIKDPLTIFLFAVYFKPEVPVKSGRCRH